MTGYCGGVVRRVRLARHRLDVDLDRRRRLELRRGPKFSRTSRVFVSPGLISVDRLRLRDRLGVCWIVSVHRDLRPPGSRRVSCTVTRKARSSSRSPSSRWTSRAARRRAATVTETMPVPWRPLGVCAARGAADPLPRATIERLARRGRCSARSSSPGRRRRSTPCSLSRAAGASLNRSSQTTSLATKRSACAARALAGAGRVRRRRALARNAAARPAGRSSRNWSDSTACCVLGPQRPGRVERLRAARRAAAAAGEALDASPRGRWLDPGGRELDVQVRGRALATACADGRTSVM